MINKRDKNRIKKVLGYHYSQQVLTVLNDAGVLNIKGLPYTANDVRKVVGGFEENLLIEKAVFKAVKNKLLEELEVDVQKKEVFKIKKSKAATFDS